MIAYLDGEVQKLLKMPELRDKLVANGAEPVSMTPAEAARHIEAEARRWGELVRKAGIKLD